jgi:phosphoglycerate kinase
MENYEQIISKRLANVIFCASSLKPFRKTVLSARALITPRLLLNASKRFKKRWFALDKNFATLDELAAPEGKTVLVRVDINSPIKEGAPQPGPRFAECAETIRELAKRGARVVVLAHQGRAGDEDFTSLEQHAELLGKAVKKKVKFVGDLYGAFALAAISKLKNGKIMLLENTRFYAEESVDKNWDKTLMAKRLAGVSQAFVNEAFSVSHRAQTSVVGLPALLPAYAGRSLEKELNALQKATVNPERPVVYVLGGGKPDDCFKILKHAVSEGQADKVLLGGVIGELAVIASGKSLGAKKEWLDEKGFSKLLPEMQKLVAEHADKLLLPTDFAFADADGIRVEARAEELKGNERIFDVGSKTAAAFASEIKGAKTVYFKGPIGRYEETAFELGTRLVLKAIESSKAFSLMGGGNTLDAVEKFGINKKKIGHLSTSGGALLAFLGGETLPGIEALKPKN